MQNSGTRGEVHLQDDKIQGQNFAQNGNQKSFCNGPKASNLITKFLIGIPKLFPKIIPQKISTK